MTKIPLTAAALTAAALTVTAPSHAASQPRDVPFKTRSGHVWCVIQAYGVVCQTSEGLVVQAGADGKAETFHADELEEFLPPRRSIRRVIHRGQTIKAHGFRCYAARAQIRCHPADRSRGLFADYGGGAVGQLR